VPAVVVQRMVDGRASGVAFSADPVSGRRAVAVVAAVTGLASPLVSGEAAADTWRIDRAPRVLERAIEGGQPAIDEADALRVAELARRAERHFGRPQDIEWTIAAGRLYLLQSRPITTLAERADPDGVPALWDNSNIIESYGGVTTPLTFSFARRAYEQVYREFCRLIRLPENVIEAHAGTFCCMLGLIRGRVYYNLYNWYRLVAVLPGYGLNRRFMEQMMGVRESLPEAIANAQAVPGAGARAREAWRLAVSLGAFALHLATLRGRMRRFARRLNDTLGTTRPRLDGLRPDELAAYYRAIEQRLLTRWDAPIVNDFATMIWHGLLRRLSAAWLADSKDALHNDLLCGERGMISEEPARRVKQMAALAAADPGLAAQLREAAPGALRKAVAAHPALRDAVADYLDRFGDRCMEELKLESETLLDDPTPLYRAIGNAAAGASAASAPRDLEIRSAAEARMREALAGRPLKRLAFGWVLARARESLRARENLRFERTRVFGRARQIVLELGKRLAAQDCLAEPRDVFYLEIEELLGFVEGRATTTDLKGLAAVRKAEFAAWRVAPAPAERFETRGLVYRGHDYASAHPQPAPQGDVLKGLGCCPGVVRGRVRLVRDPRSARVERGEIVVAERTDPGWVMIFPSAAGLLVERGSLLSHSAIVARELGLPAIVSLAGVTQWLRDGDRVQMDGSSGIVTRLPRDDGQAAASAA
jgi:phosphohistidine swiveling domain-containing protein